jgi:hypothetical protein
VKGIESNRPESDCRQQRPRIMLGGRVCSSRKACVKGQLRRRLRLASALHISRPRRSGHFDADRRNSCNIQASAHAAKVRGPVLIHQIPLPLPDTDTGALTCLATCASKQAAAYGYPPTADVAHVTLYPSSGMGDQCHQGARSQQRRDCRARVPRGKGAAAQNRVSSPATCTLQSSRLAQCGCHTRCSPHYQLALLAALM